MPQHAEASRYAATSLERAAARWAAHLPEVSCCELYASAVPCCTSPLPATPLPINMRHLPLLGPAAPVMLAAFVAGEATEAAQATLASASGRSMVVGWAGAVGPPAVLLLVLLRCSGLLTRKGSLQLLSVRPGGGAGSSGWGCLLQCTRSGSSGAGGQQGQCHESCSVCRVNHVGSRGRAGGSVIIAVCSV